MKATIATSALAMVLAFMPAWASPGHDHGDEQPATTSSGPKRQPDGSVYLPKPAQRQIALRTLLVEEKSAPRAIELAGRVVMDPNAGGKVQPTMAGRVVPGPRGLPSVGQSVRKGEVLAYVEPSTGNLDRANQIAQAAELRASRSLAEKRVARLKELADSVPRKEIEAAESELASFDARLRAVGGGLNSRETLAAPVSGVIASANVVSGEVVEERTVLFEIVDPTRLRIEALAYDGVSANDVASATISVAGQSVPLVFVGASRSLREQALPLVFRSAEPSSAANGLAVGQPLQVVVQTKTQVKGIPVPAASLMKNPANQNVVWVKTKPERLEPRVVLFEPLDGTQVSITSGLKAGDRVVTQGATLVNQIR